MVQQRLRDSNPLIRSVTGAYVAEVRTQRLIFLCAGVVPLAACASTSPVDPPPAEFNTRTPLLSCGQTKATGPGDSIDDLYPQSALDCLVRGRAEAGAEWSVTLDTTEGDPITTYYRVPATSPAIEIFLDRSRDAHWQGDGWKRLSCTVSMITAEALRSCTNSA